MLKKKNENIKAVEPNEITAEQKVSIKTRTLVAVPLVLTFLIALVFGGWVMMAYIAILAGFALCEILKSTHKKYKPLVWIITYIFGYLVVFWPLVSLNVQNAITANQTGTEFYFSLEKSFTHLDVSLTVLGVFLIVCFLIALVDEDLIFKDIAHLFAMVLLVALGLQSMLVCRFYPVSVYGYSSIDPSAYWFRWGWSAGLLFTVYVVCSLTDVFAYFGGLLFGKHKMNPRISPKKTWEGFYIGWGMGSLFAFGIMFLFAGLNYPILPILDISHWWIIVVLGLILPLLGTLGDLAFSSIKRSEGIKDFSNILPGHGGILDRFDSPIVASLGTVIILSFFSGGWIF